MEPSASEISKKQREARRIRIIVSYDGTDFHGWQVQPAQTTIQSTIEAVLTELEGAHVSIQGSGRTDAGVHALGQVAAFSFTNPIPIDNLRRAMNHLLPPSIRILEAADVAPDFHPRFGAKAKTYEYRIFRAEICPPFDRRFVYHYPYPLNEERMIEFAPLLEGEHDFSVFAASDDKDELGRSKVRRIFASAAHRDGDLLIYRVTGSGFLKHMVRNIVGVLLEVGKGNVTREEFQARLEPAGLKSGSKISCGPSAPALGLFLVRVEYGDAEYSDAEYSDAEYGDAEYGDADTPNQSA